MKKILKVLMEIFIWTVAFAAAIIMAWVSEERMYCKACRPN